MLYHKESSVNSVTVYKRGIHSKQSSSTINMAEFSKTKRGARSLHYNGFQYTINSRGRDGQTYWRCIDRSCQGRATTDANDEIIAENNNHDHPPETAQSTVAKVVDKMKERARNETVSVNRIYREAIEEINSNPELAEVASVVPTLPSLKSSLYRKRRERLPPLTTTRDEVQFTGEWAKCTNGNQFLLKSANNIHIFATDDNLNLLSTPEDLYMDGTFQIAPCTLVLPDLYYSCIQAWTAISARVLPSSRKVP